MESRKQCRSRLHLPCENLSRPPSLSSMACLMPLNTFQRYCRQHNPCHTFFTAFAALHHFKQDNKVMYEAAEVGICGPQSSRPFNLHGIALPSERGQATSMHSNTP